MPALRVAIDLTALAQRADRPLARCRPVRFAEALIQHAQDTEFTVLARPAAYAELAHLDAPNARRVTIAEPNRAQSLLARLQARLLSRFQHSHTKPAADVALCPFTSTQLND